MPVGWVAAAFAAYHTVVVSAEAVLEVDFMSVGLPLAVIAAHFDVLLALLDSEE